MNKAVSFLVGMVAGAASLAAAAWLTDKFSRQNEENDENDFALESADNAENEATSCDSETIADETASEEQLTATA